MTAIFYSLIFGLFVAAVFIGEARAETFEFLTYTPPNGWVNQVSADKTVYQRKSGIGMIAIYTSYPTSRTASDEFAEMWQVRIAPTLPGTAPQAQIQREGNYAIAVGARQVNAPEGLTTVVLTAFVGQGQAICVLTMTTGDEALREVTAFLDSIKITPETSAAQSNSGSASTGGIEVDYEVPPGYSAKREGGVIQLIPTKIDRATPCVFVIGSSRPSSGNLETDARSALLEPFPGWQIADHESHYNALRGMAGDGWKYFLFRTTIQSLNGGSYQYLYASAMAFSAGQGRVNMVWSFASTAGGPCEDNISFDRLFHGLHPRGWKSDGGKGFAQEIPGTWRYTSDRGITQYKFMQNGRYEFDRGTRTTFGVLDTTTSAASDGNYKLNGSELILTSGSQGASKFRIRIYDHYNKGGWLRRMTVLNEAGNPARVTEYEQVVN